MGIGKFIRNCTGTTKNRILSEHLSELYDDVKRLTQNYEQIKDAKNEYEKIANHNEKLIIQVVTIATNKRIKPDKRIKDILYAISKGGFSWNKNETKLFQKE